MAMLAVRRANLRAVAPIRTRQLHIHLRELPLGLYVVPCFLS